MSNLKSIFVDRNRKPSIIRKKTKISGLSGVFDPGRRKWTLNFDSTGKDALNSYLFNPVNSNYSKISG